MRMPWAILLARSQSAHMTQATLESAAVRLRPSRRCVAPSLQLLPGFRCSSPNPFEQEVVKVNSLVLLCGKQAVELPLERRLVGGRAPFSRNLERLHARLL